MFPDEAGNKGHYELVLGVNDIVPGWLRRRTLHYALQAHEVIWRYVDPHLGTTKHELIRTWQERVFLMQWKNRTLRSNICPRADRPGGILERCTKRGMDPRVRVINVLTRMHIVV
jgi:hypothetical protein